MSNGLQEGNETLLAKEASQVIADAITHPLGFAVVVLSILVLMWGYGKFVKAGPSIDQRLRTLEEKVKGSGQ